MIWTRSSQLGRDATCSSARVIGPSFLNATTRGKPSAHYQLSGAQCRQGLGAAGAALLPADCLSPTGRGSHIALVCQCERADQAVDRAGTAHGDDRPETQSAILLRTLPGPLQRC